MTISKRRIPISSNLDQATAQTFVAVSIALDHLVTELNGAQTTTRYGGYTFATLPASPVAGTITYISDSNTATWGATVAGGGTNHVMAHYNGTNWTVMGA